MMKTILITIVTCLTSIYSISFNNIDGNAQSFGLYQGKKILIVNIASQSDKISQLTQLEQLYQQYHDSLVVIGFPSNSFNNEPKTNAEIKQFCQANYNITFPLAEKGNVSGSNMLPVYNWLASLSQNGAMEGIVLKDFQKFLIDNDGNLVGAFSSNVLPTDSLIRNAIEGNN